MSPVLADSGELRIIEGDHGKIGLSAHGQSLATIFRAVSRASGVEIRSIQTPAGSVTVQCPPAEPESLMRCILGQEADIISSRKSLPGGKPGLQAIKVLASSFDSQTASTAVTTPAPDSRPAKAPRAKQPARKSALLMAMLNSRNAEKRAEALAALTALPGTDAAMLQSALQHGLQDASGEVRAQAYAGILTTGTADRAELLQLAMQDAEADVRLVAIDHMETRDEAGQIYLNNALTDPDESVRTLAQLKLRALQPGQ